MGIHRLAGDEEAHDLARALEDQVDAEVAHHPLDGIGPLAAAAQTVGGLVAAAALDLQGVVDDPPSHLGVPHLGHRRLEADVGAAAVGHERGQVRHRLHREEVRRHAADLLRDRVVLADRLAPLHPLRGPAARDLEAALGRPRRRTPAA